MTAKLRYGYYLFVNNAAFSWRAALASILALSTAEAELISICACATEIAYARKLANELGFLQVKLTILYEDNQGAKALAEHTHFKGRSKHYQLRWSFVYTSFKIMSSVTCWLSREHQLADVQTAPRAYPVFERFSKIYGANKSRWLGALVAVAQSSNRPLSSNERQARGKGARADSLWGGCECIPLL